MLRSYFLRSYILMGLAVLLTACATTKTETPPRENPVSTSPAPAPWPPVASPTPPPETTPNTQPSTSRPADDPPPKPPSSDKAFDKLADWRKSDVRPALIAFRRNCDVWNGKNPAQAFSPYHPEFGILSDWQSLCRFARQAENSKKSAKAFFETHFYPLLLTSPQSEGGLLTGYYQPEVEVRAVPENEFSEPILAVPLRDSDRKRPRSEIGAHMARVIAYGRPMDVFFMQIQGSGVVAFENGYRVRAAYADNNGLPYTSIGGVLVRRGELTTSTASKQSIEAWMLRNGPVAARALMNENKRYIFFSEETLVPGEGPMGAMRAPLTAMGSLAVDPTQHPYGLPIWINVKLPQSGGDYRGKKQGQLVIAQDTGKAIKGQQRGDIYFGEGYEAGSKAGVMKHRGRWAILMPRHLLRLLPTS